MHAKPDETKKHACHCPYCDSEIEESCFPFCIGCGVTVFTCPDCGKPFPKEEEVCPNCGTRIKQ